MGVIYRALENEIRDALFRVAAGVAAALFPNTLEE